LKKQLERFELASLQALRDTLLSRVEEVNGVSFLGEVVEVTSADALKKLAFELKPRLTNYIIALAANVEGKASVVLLFDDATTAEKGLDAGQIIKKQVAPLIKGGGGGQKTLATAGGQDVSALHQVITAVKGLL
jgi:alanyl-tRNA synthetase